MAIDPRGVGLESSDPHPTARDVGLGGSGSSSGGLGEWPGRLDSLSLVNCNKACNGMAIF